MPSPPVLHLKAAPKPLWPATFVISICGQHTDSTNSTDNPRAVTCKHCLRLLGVQK
jgi:hypothetical protein